MAEQKEENGKIKVCIGLSGGVDSSVAALLLKEQGYDVFAMFMQNWHDADSTLHGDCEWEEDRFVAELVARKIGIPFYFVDLSKEYRQRVVDYMFDEYSKGRTPNPDVLCNREIKFDAFMKVAEKYGAAMVATGHYCRKEAALDELGQPILDSEGKQIYRLLEGSDPNKDQSYFLCQLSQEQLSKTLFPIGELRKPEVRQKAKEADLPSADKKDSQGICFVGKVDLPTFLKQKLTSVEGDVVEIYDAYYESDKQYQFMIKVLSSLRNDGMVPTMTGGYVKEVKLLTSDGEPLGESPYDSEAIASLPDEVLERLSKPVKYDISFELVENALASASSAKEERRLAALSASVIMKGSVAAYPKAQTAITVVMVSGGYPESYKKGFEITGLGSVTESTVFHAGTKPDSGRVLTDGGRVLAVTSLADGIQPALDKSYRSIGGIKFDGAYFRRDIGQDLQKL